ncbi:hypothetical protein SAMN05192566_0727 [Methylophilus rhizosphaerae]|uniref:Uncharacterized protein n=1 Tax=Methylophilus rhizosphaerae TaxID=492660 RepID=A0A1G9A783_9PROT|nr:hypothetical protein [Methylophilus rhizosphaerae]SDK23206.1 hypothetical protein SAMN05192566_0727 [Methylophilus rhizosphaerae]
MNKLHIFSACLMVVLATGCSKKEESATDILETIELPAKVVPPVAKPKPMVAPKPIEPIKEVSPTPTIKEVVKTAPLEPIKKAIEALPVKEPITIKQVEIKPVVPVKTTPTVIISNKEPKKEKEKIIYSVEFE